MGAQEALDVVPIDRRSAAILAPTAADRGQAAQVAEVDPSRAGAEGPRDSPRTAEAEKLTGPSRVVDPGLTRAGGSDGPPPARIAAPARFRSSTRRSRRYFSSHSQKESSRRTSVLTRSPRGRVAGIRVLAVAIPAFSRGQDRRRQADLRDEDLIVVHSAKCRFEAADGAPRPFAGRACYKRRARGPAPEHVAREKPDRREAHRAGTPRSGVRSRPTSRASPVQLCQSCVVP